MAACCASSVGRVKPARTATSRRIRSACWATAVQTIHGSGQPEPTGVRTPVNPDSSAALATSLR